MRNLRNSYISEGKYTKVAKEKKLEKINLEAV